MTIFYLHLFFLAYLKLECLLAMGFTIFTFKAHRRNRNSVSKLLWPKTEQTKSLHLSCLKHNKKVLSLPQLPSTETLHHQSTSFIVQPRAAAIWRKMTNNFFLLVCLMTILWLQSHGFQRCVPSLCQSSDFCQLPFRNSSFFQNNAGLFILLHFCGRKKVMVQPPYVYFLYIPVKERTITGVRVVNISFLCGVHQVESGKWKVGNFW